MKRLLKRTILPAPGPRRLPLGIGLGLTMWIDFDYQTRTYLGLYEIELNRYLRRILEPGATAFDVGAQHGYDSLVIAGHTGSRVAAFDCEPACARLMRRNFELNPGLANLLEPVEACVGDQPEQTGLDEYAYAESGFVPDFIKVDVDGGELGVLRSARRLLADRGPALIVETHSAGLERACGRLLAECGYRLVVVNQRRFMPDHRPTTELNRWLVARRPGDPVRSQASLAEAPASPPSMAERSMRIAWTGSAVGTAVDSGAAALGGMLLAQVLEQGVEVDLYHPGDAAEVPGYLRDHPNLSIVGEPVRFEWDRWYSSNRVAAFVSGSASRIVTQVKLARLLVKHHRRRRYDAIFQFSQLELLALGLARRVLPPIVVHPCTTAAREIHWHRKESRYALQAESWLQHYLVRALLRLRTSIQRRELRKPRLIAGPSETFNRLMCEDYGVEPTRTRVLRHPVDAGRFGGVQRRPDDGGPVVLLYVARFSARKGLELVTGLSHRLADLAGEVEIKLLGGGSLWSDYTAHLRDLHPAVAEHIGGVPAADMPDVYATADVLLAPSHYEPGSLVVGEALSAGLRVVASDQVGPVEVVDRRVCRVFPAGDLDALEREVRDVVAAVRTDRNGANAKLARREAQEHFAPEKIGRELVRILDEVSASAR